MEEVALRGAPGEPRVFIAGRGPAAGEPELFLRAASRSNAHSAAPGGPANFVRVGVARACLLDLFARGGPATPPRVKAALDSGGRLLPLARIWLPLRRQLAG